MIEPVDKQLVYLPILADQDEFDREFLKQQEIMSTCKRGSYYSSDLFSDSHSVTKSTKFIIQ